MVQQVDVSLKQTKLKMNPWFRVISLVSKQHVTLSKGDFKTMAVEHAPLRGAIALSDISARSEFHVTLISGKKCTVKARDLFFDRNQNNIVWHKTLSAFDKQAGSITFRDEVDTLFADIVQAMTEHTAVKGTAVFREGDAVDSMILLEEGELSVEGTDQNILADSLVGFCTSQFTSRKRDQAVYTHTFVATTETKYLVLRHSDLIRLLRKHNTKLLGLTGAVVDQSVMLKLSKVTSVSRQDKKQKRKRPRIIWPQWPARIIQIEDYSTPRLEAQINNVKVELKAVKQQADEMKNEMKETKEAVLEVLAHMKARD